MFPWSGWFRILARVSLRNWRAWDRRALFLVCWAAIPFLFFSLSRSKLPGYILPIIPALALLMGATLAEWIESGEFGRRVRAAAALQALLSLGMCVALPIVFEKSYGQHWFATLPISVAVAVPALAALIYVRRRDARRAVAAVVCQGLLLVLALTQFAYPALGRYHSTREIAQKLVSVREAGEPAVTFRFFHHTLHYYTGYGMTADLGDLEALRRQLADAGKVLVVTEARHLPEIALLDRAGITALAQQGKLRLLRLRLRPGPDN